MHVKHYILKHNLFDPKNPLKILLHGNELGSLLGKSEFSLLDVRDILLQKFVFPVSQKTSSEVICSISDKMCVSKKRKLDNGDSEFSAKRIKGLDDTSYCDSDESIYSFQDYETEFVKDSASDDNFSVNGLIIAETFDVDVEYEIETDSDYSCESDSDLEDFVKTAIINFIAETTDSDIEYLADRSSDDESEKELSEGDKWRCNCGMLNDPVMRCCCACWKTRVGWLSERSKRRNERDTWKSKQREFARNKRKLSKKSYKNKDSSNHKPSDLSSSTAESFSSPSTSCNGNSDVKLSDLPSATAESLSSPSTSCNGNSDVKLSDLPSATAESLSSPSTSCNDSSDVILSQSSSNTLEGDKNNTRIELDKQLCLFCCSKPADCSILHGKTACRVCCFKCGQKLHAGNKRCPVCRRAIERIVYLYHL
ncbi:hypothetical protein AVEN_123516-1 [Araneus ventricosus]|uniref:E3 ubiquitin-protein ligase Mdm2 n=1 Tax=Araneus ventricosus TaxID=182803 RepID=A0A4Y2GTG9_ARAVE|nr:hypothetical protein AVEN_123516-1 [Araneus ventricosus]